MKVTVIGGGSTYTPELVTGFLERVDSFPITELCLMDISAERLDLVGTFARRIVKADGAPFDVSLSTDQRQAVSGAAYVITQLRVGMMEARREDEYLGKRHGLIGQETTGVGGMAKALRTIPVVLDIARDVRETARKGKPLPLLVNFTNPAGLITEALFRHAPDVPSVGVCNVAITTKMGILEGLRERTKREYPPRAAQLDTLGLNHLTWHRGFTTEGTDVWPQVIQGYIRDLEESDHPHWNPHLIRTLGMIPNYYLQYYYYTNRKLEAQEAWPPSRAEEVMEIERSLLDQYADPALARPPDDLMKRGGAYYSTLATQLLDAHYNDRGETHVVNVRHDGAVSAWPEDWVLEMPCSIDGDGVHPLPTEPLPPVCSGLLSHVKSFEVLTVEAAVHGDRDAAYRALLAHPLGPSANRVEAVLEDMLESHEEYLEAFWR